MSGYIGFSPVLQSNEHRQEFTITAVTQDTFATIGYAPGFISVYRNGVRLSEHEDFTATDGSSVTLNTPAVTGDLVSLEYRTEVVEILDQSVTVSKLNFQPNDIPIDVINIADDSIPVSAITFTANSINVSSVDMSGVNLDAGAKSDVFYENSNILTESYTISENKNAITAGPITVADGAIVTVPANSVWTVV